MKTTKILQEGRNCWRICRAERVAFLVDGACYFKALYNVLPQAKRQILLLSWDIHSELHLLPPEEAVDSDWPTSLNELFNQLLRNKPQLHIHILNWDFSLLLAPSRELLPIYKLDWKTHRRLKFHMDNKCSIGSSHHQKVVVLDNQLAFAGGLDLTRGRWDTPEHRGENPRREAVDDQPLPIRPYHDVQMAVSGEAAFALGDLARERWQTATGKQPAAPEPVNDQLWPKQLRVDLEKVDVAIARTLPKFADRSAITEVKQLYLDSIAAAERYIYIENQYLTAPEICHALAERLEEDNGPEIILNLPLHVEGWLGRQSMDMIRVELIRILREADQHQRFMVYYPENGPDEELAINLHAKVMIIDDRFLRIGSSNLNNRSLGLDTECDLAIEATDEDGEVQTVLHNFRNRLLGEHLDCQPDQIDAQVQQKGSLLKAIDALRSPGRTLCPLEPKLPEVDPEALNDIKLTDPEQPIDPEQLLNHFLPPQSANSASRQAIVWLAVLGLLLSAAAAWRFTPLNQWLDVEFLTALAADWRNSPATPLLVLCAFVFGSLLMVPVTAMIIVTVLIFGPFIGYSYALGGSFLSALSGYALGSLLGRDAVRQMAGKRINQVSQQLAKRGLLTMFVVRIVPVAPFTVVNLVAGASHIKFRDFCFGTLIGMAPGVLGVTLITERVEASLRSPDWQTLLTLLLVAGLVFYFGYLLAKKLRALHKPDSSSCDDETICQGR